MKIYKKIQTNCRAYKSPTAIKPVGILVHSTGCNNDELRRYVDFPEVCGKNAYGNTINNGVEEVSMHGYLGKDKNGNIAGVNTLPYDIACWGCGKGVNGSYNYNPVAHLQFEICEDDLKNKSYCKECYDAAVEYCTYLCQQFDFNPLGKNVIVSHNEAAHLGYASNHGDPEHWFSKYGYTMDGLRKAVAKNLKGEKYEAKKSINCRKGHGVAYKAVNTCEKGEKIVVTETYYNAHSKVTWGKTYKGWINLNKCGKVK